MPVHLNRSPFNARLLAWGRAADGWHALVTFAVRVRRRGGELEHLTVAAWVPADAITKPGWASSSPDIARLALGMDRSVWPAPANLRGWVCRGVAKWRPATAGRPRARDGTGVAKLAHQAQAPGVPFLAPG